jgi:hypothetical protein
VFETLDDIVFDRSELGDVLGEHRQIVRRRRPRQAGRVLGRQAKGTRRGVALDDPAGHHGAEPFAHIAFVEAGPRGDVGAGAPNAVGQAVEQAGAMADRGHQTDRPGVEHIDEPLFECRGLGR